MRRDMARVRTAGALGVLAVLLAAGPVCAGTPTAAPPMPAPAVAPAPAPFPAPTTAAAPPPAATQKAAAPNAAAAPAKRTAAAKKSARATERSARTAAPRFDAHSGRASAHHRATTRSYGAPIQKPILARHGRAMAKPRATTSRRSHAQHTPASASAARHKSGREIGYGGPDVPK